VYVPRTSEEAEIQEVDGFWKSCIPNIIRFVTFVLHFSNTETGKAKLDGGGAHHSISCTF
jgi:hypothetical protein